MHASRVSTACVVGALALCWACVPDLALAQRMPAPSTPALQAQGLQEHSLQVGDLRRWFLVQPPPDASKPAPVLLVLHGGGQSMRRLVAPEAGATQGWPALALRENALLLLPNGVNADDQDTRGDNQNWNDLREGVSRGHAADDTGFLLALVDWAQKNHRTDADRVYVTGASNGGIMSFRLLMEAPEPFAAAAAFVAALPKESSRFKTPSRPTPLMIANGTHDPLMQWQGGQIAGGRGETRSVADTVQWWLQANKAGPTATETVTLPDRDPQDGCTIERRTYPAQAGGAPVVTYTLRGGGHNLPSARYPLRDSWMVRRFIGPVCKDAEGPELVWEFLSAHRRP